MQFNFKLNNPFAYHQLKMMMLLISGALIGQNQLFASTSISLPEVASSASAQDSDGSVSATIKKSSHPLSDDLYLNYFATFHGPQFDHLDSPNTVNQSGNISKYGMNFDSEITAAYLVKPSLGVGISVPFIFSPVLGQGFTLGDLGFKAFEKKLVTTQTLTIGSSLFIQAPTSQASQDRGMTLGLKFTPFVRYFVPHSRFTLGAWTEEKDYFGVSPLARDKKDFKLWALPYVSYQLSEHFALNFAYELEAHHDVGNSALSFSMYQTDFQPGFVYLLNSKVSINPYAQLFTGNSVNGSLAFGAVISATL